MLSHDGIGSVCEPVQNWVLVPKGLQDSARGFNPGIQQKKGPPQRGGRAVVITGLNEGNSRTDIPRPFRAARDVNLSWG